MSARSTASLAELKKSQPLLAAIHDDLTLLSALHAAELSAETFTELKALGFPQCLGFALTSAPARELDASFQALLKGWPDAPDTQMLDELAADYASIYLNAAYGASPQESYWLDDEQLVMQKPMFQVRKIYEGYGLQAENWRVRADDHIFNELSFLTHLFALVQQDPAEESAATKLLEDAAQFMDEHLLRWLRQFAERVATRCDTPFYAHLMLLTEAYCEELRDLLAELLDVPRPDPAEIEERMAEPNAVQVAVPAAFAPGAEPSW